jgi:hypothetical protein
MLEMTGDPWDLSDAQAGLGAVNVLTGDLVRAAALYRESLDRAQEQGMTVLVGSALFGLAAIASAAGQPESGAHLLGAAEGITAPLGVPLFPRDSPVRDHALAALTTALGEERLAAAREAGRALTMEAAIGEARAMAESIVA